MKKNAKTIRSVILVVLTVSWILYGIQIYPLFLEVDELTTSGVSFIIKLLEFTNYRGIELSTIFIEYFILVTISLFFYLYVLKRYSNKKKSFIFLLCSVVVIGGICFISNIFFGIYLILTLLAVVVVYTSNYVSLLIWGKDISYDKDDIVFKSQEYKLEITAKNELDKKIKEYSQSKLSGEVFKIDNDYYFEIYANEKIILDNKGEKNKYEEN